MAITAQDDRFPQAAGRHLTDARILATSSRLDNAVYLAGYVVECSLKAVISHHLGESEARRWRHDLAGLQGPALQRLTVLVPHAHLRLPASRTHGTVLDDGHPTRRYWASGRWTQQQTTAAVERAFDIYRDTILAMILDGDLGAEELTV